MRRQAAHKEQKAKKLQEQGDRLARMVVNQLEPTPPWFHHQEINRQEVARCRALQEEVVAAAAVVVEEAKAREQTWQCQTHHQHNKQVHFLVPMGR